MSDKPDMSALFSMLANAKGNTNMKPEELLTTLMNSSSHSSNTMHREADSSHETISTNIKEEKSQEETSSTNGSTDMSDMEIIMQFMRAMKSSRQDSPSKELLKSLKPFLNESRREKVDQYIQILGLTKALEMFQEMGDLPK